MKNITSIRKNWLSACFFLLLTSSGLFAQKLSEKLGGITTDFIIISGDDTLDVDKQFIIKRAKYDAEYDYRFDGDGGYGYGYGYGYQSFHLEFTSKDNIAKTKAYKSGVKSEWYVTFHCYDKEGKQLLEMFVPSSRLKEGKNAKIPNSYIYSLNLIGIPIVVLDNTTTINIEWQNHSWKHEK